ncbi:ethanolamine ammonia-lyase subunit EutC [Nibrella saemangeumensis]|uniref:Ethanolamine ammonia-lyase small subunit n=1 Tax=Nibrella saemangeumensis TaxID=1084526 RepID=A0ABP8N577_9BACT
MNDLPVSSDAWNFLQSYTPARIAQGLTGHSLPTQALLDFQLDHARARDAVYSELDTAAIVEQLEKLHPQVLSLHSQATDRRQYLQRPDFGRRLDSRSRETLTALAPAPSDLCVVIADGLSATAINRHAIPVVSKLIVECKRMNWSMAPLCVAEQGRVAIADEIAHGLNAEMVVILIGERPGLTSPDSLGAYLTYQPKPGLTDESRNCISNIRPEGLSNEAAVQKLLYLLGEMKTRRLSGVHLKDEMLGLLP